MSCNTCDHEHYRNPAHFVSDSHGPLLHTAYGRGRYTLHVFNARNVSFELVDLDFVLEQNIYHDLMQHQKIQGFFGCGGILQESPNLLASQATTSPWSLNPNEILNEVTYGVSNAFRVTESSLSCFVLHL
jgi:hypothetical protein